MYAGEVRVLMFGVAVRRVRASGLRLDASQKRCVLNVPSVGVD